MIPQVCLLLKMGILNQNMIYFSTAHQNKMGNSDYKVNIPSPRQTVTTEGSILVLYYTGTQ